MRRCLLLSSTVRTAVVVILVKVVSVLLTLPADAREMENGLRKRVAGDLEEKLRPRTESVTVTSLLIQLLLLLMPTEDTTTQDMELYSSAALMTVTFRFTTNIVVRALVIPLIRRRIASSRPLLPSRILDVPTETRILVEWRIRDLQVVVHLSQDVKLNLQFGYIDLREDTRYFAEYA